MKHLRRLARLAALDASLLASLACGSEDPSPSEGDTEALVDEGSGSEDGSTDGDSGSDATPACEDRVRRLAAIELPGSAYGVGLALDRGAARLLWAAWDELVLIDVSNPQEPAPGEPWEPIGPDGETLSFDEASVVVVDGLAFLRAGAQWFELSLDAPSEPAIEITPGGAWPYAAELWTVGAEGVFAAYTGGDNCAVPGDEEPPSGCVVISAPPYDHRELLGRSAPTDAFRGLQLEGDRLAVWNDDSAAAYGIGGAAELELLDDRSAPFFDASEIAAAAVGRSHFAIATTQGLHVRTLDPTAGTGDWSVASNWFYQRTRMVVDGDTLHVIAESGSGEGEGVWWSLDLRQAHASLPRPRQLTSWNLGVFDGELVYAAAEEEGLLEILEACDE